MDYKIFYKKQKRQKRNFCAFLVVEKKSPKSCKRLAEDTDQSNHFVKFA